MKNKTLDKRYAKALLALGKEDGKFDLYGENLNQLAEALTQVPDQMQALTSPVFPKAIRGKMLMAILAKAGLSPIVNNFIQLLMDKGRLVDLPGIAEAYKIMSDVEKGLVRAHIISAVPLGKPEIKSISDSLNKFTQKQVILTVDQDPSIIGGLVAKLGDLVIDGSVRTQLSNLSARLNRL